MSLLEPGRLPHFGPLPMTSEVQGRAARACRAGVSRCLGTQLWDAARQTRCWQGRGALQQVALISPRLL